eukprot:TRINITY_DN2589_c0_g1_i2.p1 TRINITY_DN2589_c0_g1~~TRINITY_DN2589_c0_g1_i2.p1  ORF type:complete len:420 (+),score=80.43 TRINITY_DN2589_c0_g1_i2:246-1505(+)
MDYVASKDAIRTELSMIDRDLCSDDYDMKSKELAMIDTYKPQAGVTEVRELVAELINQWYDIGIDGSNVIITVGATESLLLTFMGLVEPGVKAGLFVPYFPVYNNQIRALGGEAIFFPMKDSRFDGESFEKILSENLDISFIILNDPCNPTGVKWTDSELLELSMILSKPEFQHVLVVLDETYHELFFSDSKFWLGVVDREEFLPRTIMLSSFSKCFIGSPSLRAGFVYAPHNLKIAGQVVDMASIFSTQMLNINTGSPYPVQIAMKVVLEAHLGKSSPEYTEIHNKWNKDMKDEYGKLRNYILEIFTHENNIPCVTTPEGGFFAYIDFSYLLGKEIPESFETWDGRTLTNLRELVGKTILETDHDIAMFILYAMGVVVIIGSGFSDDPSLGRMRISYAQPLPYLRNACEKLLYGIKQM